MNTKKSAINYLINRMNTYPISQENKDHEQTIINEMLKNNGYQQQLTDFKYINKVPINLTQTARNTQKDKIKWATFTYVGPETRTVTSKVRYREHINTVRTNKQQNSKFAQHILETEHTCSPIDQTVEILHIENKGPKLNTLERFHVLYIRLNKEGSTDE
jgi:hypothetical protein